MTNKTIYSILKGKSYYNGISALGIAGLRIHTLNDTDKVKSLVVGNDKTVWVIYFCTGLRGRPSWTIGETIER